MPTEPLSQPLSHYTPQQQPQQQMPTLAERSMPPAHYSGDASSEAEAPLRRLLCTAAAWCTARPTCTAVLTAVVTPSLQAQQYRVKGRHPHLPRKVGLGGHTRAAWRRWREMAASNSALLRFAAACRVHRLQDAMAVLFDVWVAARERGVETRQMMMRGNVKGATHSMRSALHWWSSVVADELQQAHQAAEMAFACARMVMSRWHAFADSRKVSSAGLQCRHRAFDHWRHGAWYG